MIGCDCAVCRSEDPHDTRTRPSIYVRFGRQCILVDTTPELRVQCIANGIKAVHAVLFTHHHADHVAGLDDLRRFNGIMKQPIACYGAERTLTNLRRMFLYAFEPAPDSPHSRPQLDLRPIGTRPFTIGDETIIPIPLMHGPLPVLGFRFGRFAYCTDCNHIRCPIGPVCTQCLAEQFEWHEMSGKAELHTWVNFYQGFHPEWAKESPYNVALVKLEEGPIFLSNVVADDDDLAVGIALELVFDDVTDDVSIPKFKLAD